MIRIFLFFSLVSFSLFAQNDPILARVENTTITVSEFKERFEFTPRTAGSDNIDSLKKYFLYTLISEKLFFEAAQKAGLDTLPYIRTHIGILRDMYVRDALYQAVVKDRVVIDSEAFRKGMERYGIVLKVKGIFAASEEEAVKLYAALQSGASFDSLLALRPEAAEQTEPLEVAFGQSPPAIEDAVFALKPKTFSPLVETPLGKAIFFLYEYNDSVRSDPNKQSQMSSLVRQVLEGNQEEQYSRAFIDSLLSGSVVNIDGPFFASLTKKFLERAEAIYAALPPTRKENRLKFSEKDFDELERSFTADSLKRSFIKFPDTPLSLYGYLQELRIRGFDVGKAERNIIMNALNTDIRTTIFSTLMSKEGYTRGYDKLPEVQRSLNMWKQSYLASAFRHTLNDQARPTEEEAYDYYLKNNKAVPVPPRVNVIELLTDSLEVVEMVLQRVNMGEDFRALAMTYTKRDSLRAKNCEFGLFPEGEYGDIGRIAAQIEIGRVYGPIKVPEGFSIIKVIEKLPGDTLAIDSFEQQKDVVKQALFFERYKNLLTDETVSLAANSGIEINDAELAAVPVTEVNMVVFRYMGFGGKINAAPYLDYFYQWYEAYQNKKTIVQ